MKRYPTCGSAVHCIVVALLLTRSDALFRSRSMVDVEKKYNENNNGQLLHREGIYWNNVSVFLPKRKKLSFLRRNRRRCTDGGRYLLHPNSGFAKNGEVCAIIGQF